MSRLSSWKRADNPPNMRVTDRDKEIVLAVYRYRFLNAHQIEALLFPPHPTRGRSRKQACQRRLQRLFHHGFLTRLPLPIVLGAGRVPFVYALDERGATLVATELGVDRPHVSWKAADNQVKPLFLDHTQAINTVRVVVERLHENCTLSLVRWLDERALQNSDRKDTLPFRMRGARIMRIIPDGYFALQFCGAPDLAHFFLEVDQGTMSHSRWKDKIAAYMHFRQSGRSEKYFGTRNFRLLTVTTTKKRLDNLKTTTEKVGGDRYFWFTTQESLSLWDQETFLHHAWHVAGQETLLPLSG